MSSTGKAPSTSAARPSKTYSLPLHSQPTPTQAVSEHVRVGHEEATKSTKSPCHLPDKMKPPKLNVLNGKDTLNVRRPPIEDGLS